MSGTEAYDSQIDTLTHIARVRELLEDARCDLMERALDHDLSKLEDPEKSIFDEFTPKLRGMTYGSDEYKAALAGMKPALDHHYAHNRHHPEFFSNGVAGMTLIDLIEMLCDWKAATERHADGNLQRSIQINRERFNVSDQLTQILENTRLAMGW